MPWLAVDPVIVLPAHREALKALVRAHSTSQQLRPLVFASIPDFLALQAALANRRLIRITVFYGPAALGAKGLAAASLPMVVASTL
jgi:hypothetical protein